MREWINLTIKGGWKTTKRELEKRGCSQHRGYSYNSLYNTSHVQALLPGDTAFAWFNESAELTQGVGFPEGTLLYYT